MSMRTKLFHLWFRFQRPMTLGVRALVFNSDGRVLLVRHTYVPGWHLCGGGVEVGDTFEETLAKELEEEANIVLTTPAALLSIHLNKQTSKRDHVAVYVAHDVQQTAPKKSDREIVSAEFFALDALPADVTTATLRRINEYKQTLPPDPYW